MAGVWISEPELNDLLGKSMAAALCRACGGVAYYIPAEASVKHQFAPLIGMSGMRALCAAFPSQWVTVPNGRKAEAKKAAIVQMLEKGHAQAAIATELGVTERWVCMVAGSLRRDTQYKLPF